jgi:dTDP-4-amino-4,6-dideoxygalactose transaminase
MQSAELLFFFCSGVLCMPLAYCSTVLGVLVVRAVCVFADVLHTGCMDGVSAWKV